MTLHDKSILIWTAGCPVMTEANVRLPSAGLASPCPGSIAWTCSQLRLLLLGYGRTSICLESVWNLPTPSVPTIFPQLVYAYLLLSALHKTTPYRPAGSPLLDLGLGYVGKHLSAANHYALVCSKRRYILTPKIKSHSCKHHLVYVFLLPTASNNSRD